MIDRERWGSAPDWEAYLAGVEKHRELWHAVSERVRLPDDLVARARALPDDLRLGILSEDWCGDAVNVVPVVAALAREVGWQVRVFARDDNPDIMDAHLTGSSRSIPVVMVLDGDLDEQGWWGPRPAVLQEWMLTQGLAMPKDERYKEVRRWFARDRGRSVLEELLEIMESCCAGV